jgi:hypothetical protein
MASNPPRSAILENVAGMSPGIGLGSALWTQSIHHS